MKYLTRIEETDAIKWFNLAIEMAKQSTCLRDKCGSVVVKDNEIIGNKNYWSWREG